jgi:hypothetical protein
MQIVVHNRDLVRCILDFLPTPELYVASSTNRLFRQVKRQCSLARGPFWIRGKSLRARCLLCGFWAIRRYKEVHLSFRIDPYLHNFHYDMIAELSTREPSLFRPTQIYYYVNLCDTCADKNQVTVQVHSTDHLDCRQLQHLDLCLRPARPAPPVLHKRIATLPKDIKYASWIWTRPHMLLPPTPAQRITHSRTFIIFKDDYDRWTFSTYPLAELLPIIVLSVFCIVLIILRVIERMQ